MSHFDFNGQIVDRQTYSRTDIKQDRQSEGQIDRKTDRWKNRQTESQIGENRVRDIKP